MMKDNRIRKVISILLTICMLTVTWPQAGFIVLAEETDTEEAFLETDAADDLLTEDTGAFVDEQDDEYEVVSDLSPYDGGIFADNALLDDTAEEYLIEDEFIYDYDTAEDFVETVDGLDVSVIYAEADADTEAPVINLSTLSVSISEGKTEATAGDVVTYSVAVSDDREVDKVEFAIRKPLTGGWEYLSATYDSDTGLWSASFTVDDQTENGAWRLGRVSARDTGGNWAMIADASVGVMGGQYDLSAYGFMVIAPECPLDLTTPGYSMMLDGAGATTAFGGIYYVNMTEEIVTPDVKVRFDSEDGTWTTLAPRKYTLKYEKKTGDDSWEEYTDSTFGVDENGTATYRVSATGIESLYYTGTVGPVEFSVIQKKKVTFDSRGGSSVDP